MRDNVPEPLDGPSAGRILTERNVGPNLIVIGRVFREDSPKVLGVKYDHMISALAPDRPDHAFNISVLPGRAERGGPVPDAYCSHASLEREAECSVIVANEIFWGAVPWKRFRDLARQPVGRRIAGHRKPQQPSPLVAQNQKCEQPLKRNRRNHK